MCPAAQCVSCVEVGGEVDSLLLGGGYLFVGMHKGGEGIIKVWNMATGANHLLTGHKVRARSTHAAGRTLQARQHASTRVGQAASRCCLCGVRVRVRGC